MPFRSFPFRRRKAYRLILFLVALVSLCGSMLPTLALAKPLAARGSYKAAPDPVGPSTTTPLIPELSPAGTPSGSASPTASPSVMPTTTPEPTHTPQLVRSVEATRAPSATDSQQSAPASTPTSASSPAQPSPRATAQSDPTAAAPAQTASAVVVAQALHLREGPGARYPIRAIYGRGTEVRVLGRDRAAHWLRVITPDERAGWMAVGAVELRAPLEDLLIVDGALPSGGASDEAMPPDLGGAPSSSGSRAPTDSGIVASAADVSTITDAPKGLAVVAAEQTILHIAPGTRSEGVQALLQNEQVKLLGQARGAWVRVQAFTAVVPGWVYAADLSPLPGAISGAPAVTETLTVSSTITQTPASARVASTPTLVPVPTAMVVEAIPEPEVETPAPVSPRIPVEIAVAVMEATSPALNRPPGPSSTALGTHGVMGMRVQVVTIFGDVLVEAMTPSSGKVTFTRDVPADTALYVQVPALGLRMPLPPDEVQAGNVSTTIAVPSTTR